MRSGLKARIISLFIHFILNLVFFFFFLNHSENDQMIDIPYCKKINCYSLSSFSYSIMGIFVYFYPMNYIFMDAYFPFALFIQGFISYLSDSYYFGDVSIFHKIDRSFASYNALCGFIVAKKYNANFFLWLIIAIGLSSLKIGGYYLNQNKIKLYCFFHILWHISIPFATICMIIFRTVNHS